MPKNVQQPYAADDVSKEPEPQIEQVGTRSHFFSLQEGPASYQDLGDAESSQKGQHRLRVQRTTRHQAVGVASDRTPSTCAVRAFRISPVRRPRVACTHVRGYQRLHVPRFSDSYEDAVPRSIHDVDRGPCGARSTSNLSIHYVRRSSALGWCLPLVDVQEASVLDTCRVFPRFDLDHFDVELVVQLRSFLRIAPTGSFPPSHVRFRVQTCASCARLRRSTRTTNDVPSHIHTKPPSADTPLADAPPSWEDEGGTDRSGRSRCTRPIREAGREGSSGLSTPGAVTPRWDEQVRSRVPSNQDLGFPWEDASGLIGRDVGFERASDRLGRDSCPMEIQSTIQAHNTAQPHTKDHAKENQVRLQDGWRHAWLDSINLRTNSYTKNVMPDMGMILWLAGMYPRKKAPMPSVRAIVCIA